MLSVSLGAAETTLMSLTSAYAPFVNGGKKLNQNLFHEYKTEEVKQFSKEKSIKCIGCDKFNDQETELPKIENSSEKIISEETAYQMTSILQGAVKRGTAKKLRSLKVQLAEKQERQMTNYDAWFIGFSSNLVIGVILVLIILKL